MRLCAENAEHASAIAEVAAKSGQPKAPNEEKISGRADARCEGHDASGVRHAGSILDPVGGDCSPRIHTTRLPRLCREQLRIVDILHAKHGSFASYCNSQQRRIHCVRLGREADADISAALHVALDQCSKSRSNTFSQAWQSVSNQGPS